MKGFEYVWFALPASRLETADDWPGLDILPDPLGDRAKGPNSLLCTAMYLEAAIKVRGRERQLIKRHTWQATQ